MLTSVTVVDPTVRLRSDPSWSGWLRGQQSVDRVMSRVAPPLFLSTVALAAAASLVAAGRRRPGLAVRARWDEGHRQRQVLVGAAAVAVALVSSPAGGAPRG